MLDRYEANEANKAGGQKRSRRSWLLVVCLGLSTTLIGCDTSSLSRIMPAVSALAAASKSSTTNIGGMANPLSALTSMTNNNSGYGNPRNNNGFGRPTNTTNTGGLPNSDTFAKSGKKTSKAEIGRLLEAAGKRHGIPDEIIKAVAYQESTWRANAESYDGGHGKGVMQIDDRSHKFAKTAAVWDPAQNIEYGANFLKELYQKHGNWTKALKGYNGGSAYPPKIMALAKSQPWSQWA